MFKRINKKNFSLGIVNVSMCELFAKSSHCSSYSLIINDVLNEEVVVSLSKG
jgi:hypothetical protein